LFIPLYIKKFQKLYILYRVIVTYKGKLYKNIVLVNIDHFSHRLFFSAKPTGGGWFEKNFKGLVVKGGYILYNKVRGFFPTLLGG
jgi:hypothetical protein